MDPVRNPCSPGAGRRPAALVGRDAQLAEWDAALERITAGRTAQPIVLYGLRGVGKTVLLSDFAHRAKGRGWIVARLEARADRSLRAIIGDALRRPLGDLARPSASERLLRALKTMASFQAGLAPSRAWSFGLALSRVGGGGADTGNLEVDLAKVLHDVAAATEEGRGLAIPVDDAQDFAEADLSALCAAALTASQEG